MANTGNRYAALIDLCREIEPSTICEIGTHNGQRAIQMAMAAMQDGRSVHYTGYDMFEEGTALHDKREYNAKDRYHRADVETMLRQFSIRYPGFTFNLVTGDTNETLKYGCYDFVFIDGGHSVETIENDYNALKDSEVIVLDDYYLPDAQGKKPDITKYGCNILADKIGYDFLPGSGEVKGGGIVRMVRVK